MGSASPGQPLATGLLRPVYSMYVEKFIILLIAIRPSDGDVKPGGPLGAFREEQAMNRHRVSPSPSFHPHPAQYNYTTQTVTLTVILMWSAQAVRDSKIDHT